MTGDNDEILAFLRAIDRGLARSSAEGETLDLYLLGRSALILGYGVRLMTKDVDVVYVHGSALLARAEVDFGKGTAASRQYDLFLETVSSGMPPLPHGYQSRGIPIPGDWRVLRPHFLEIHDLAASKLSRFHARDREDLRILCDTGGLTTSGLQSAVDSAFAFTPEEAGDPKRTRAYKNLQTVLDYLEGRRSDL